MGTFDIEVNRIQPQLDVAFPSFAEVMNSIHGRNIWGADLTLLKQVFLLLDIRKRHLFSPTSSPGLIAAIVNLTAPRFFLEVGSFLGKTTIQVAKALDRLGTAHHAVVVSLDTWLGDTHMWTTQRNNRCAECTQAYFEALRAVHGLPLMY